MKKMMWRLSFFIFCYLTCVFAYALNSDPLPSWNNGFVKNKIIEFVKTLSNKDSPYYLAPSERIATFDNDGTLWVEKPVYAQLEYLKSRHKHWYSRHPSSPLTYTVTPFETPVEEFQQDVANWLKESKHPRFERPYTELIYQPMLELMNYLRENNFQVYIVSGGGQEFIRSFAPDVYNIPVDHVIGSTSRNKYSTKNNSPIILKTRKVLFICDKEGKPEAIHLFLGKKPTIAVGNSIGDSEMLEWTQSGTGKRLMLLVHHDDEKREYAYDTDSKIGSFPVELMQKAKANDWDIISMKNDWKVIFPFEKN